MSQYRLRQPAQPRARWSNDAAHIWATKRGIQCLKTLTHGSFSEPSIALHRQQRAPTTKSADCSRTKLIVSVSLPIGGKLIGSKSPDPQLNGWPRRSVWVRKMIQGGTRDPIYIFHLPPRAGERSLSIASGKRLRAMNLQALVGSSIPPDAYLSASSVSPTSGRSRPCLSPHFR